MAHSSQDVSSIEKLLYSRSHPLPGGRSLEGIPGPSMLALTWNTAEGHPSFRATHSFGLGIVKTFYSPSSPSIQFCISTEVLMPKNFLINLPACKSVSGTASQGT